MLAGLRYFFAPPPRFHFRRIMPPLLRRYAASGTIVRQKHKAGTPSMAAADFDATPPRRRQLRAAFITIFHARAPFHAILASVTLDMPPFLLFTLFIFIRDVFFTPLFISCFHACCCYIYTMRAKVRLMLYGHAVKRVRLCHLPCACSIDYARKMRRPSIERLRSPILLRQRQRLCERVYARMLRAKYFTIRCCFVCLIRRLMLRLHAAAVMSAPILCYAFRHAALFSPYCHAFASSRAMIFTMLISPSRHSPLYCCRLRYGCL